jgi:ATP-binding protein involved in chromosome partitioning
VIVTLPQAVSLEDASRGLEMFKTLNVPILGVIENMSYLSLPDGSSMDVFGKGGGESMANHYGVPFLGAIPLNPNVRIGGDNGKPIVISEPESDAAKALISLAEIVAAHISVAALTESNAPTIDVI